MAHDRQVRRCAVYTRKSSEEGLEQDFNSLQAQREACEAFIASQRGEGWKLVAAPYDDGGISGGTMERPALKRLLADVEAGQIDVIVVYKVDRLTRSLADFAKMVELFDAKGISFVAVTQQFNTTTSMGRLTLNVLLSFAQFEREVTGERIRDKIAASKKKGMWMGGALPLGYRVENRRLMVIPEEADRVRDIFRRYLLCSGVKDLVENLRAAGIRSKDRPDKPATTICRGALYALLTNPIYIGQIPHKDQRYPGLHEAIVDRTLWDAVQAKLQSGAVRTGSSRKVESSALMGKIRDESGQVLTPSHAVKNGRRYRYYVSKPDEKALGKSIWRLPASEIEGRIGQIVGRLLADRPAMAGAAVRAGVPESELKEFRGSLERSPACLEWVDEVQLQAGAIKVELTVPYRPPVKLEVSVPAQLRRRGVEQRLVIAGPQAESPADATLIKTLSRAMRWWDALKSGKLPSISAIAKAEGVTARYVGHLLPLAFLGPKLVEAIVQGKQPRELTAQDLIKGVNIPGCWSEQRRQLMFS